VYIPQVILSRGHQCSTTCRVVDGFDFKMTTIWAEETVCLSKDWSHTDSPTAPLCFSWLHFMQILLRHGESQIRNLPRLVITISRRRKLTNFLSGDHWKEKYKSLITWRTESSTCASRSEPEAKIGILWSTAGKYWSPPDHDIIKRRYVVWPYRRIAADARLRC
jgi:hypothetical protein